ncbi:hypothetical protein NW757_013876 [Fusarium falciforme]|nr:hypothetical protein NW757_013876 [Fusarium falciforme]
MDESTGITPLYPYQYDPLQEGQIRILFIQWAPNTDDVLTAAIHQAKPQELDYNAVSYAWSTDPGGEDEVPILLIDAVEVEVEDTTVIGFTTQPRRYITVKESMHKMLVSLGHIGEPRAGADSSESAYCTALWIDEICINQHDGVEKASQMKMMHEVYRLSHRTIIYLGEPLHKDTDLAFETAFALASLKDIPTDEIPAEYPYWRSDANKALAINWEAIKNVHTYKQHYTDLATLRGNPWTYFTQIIMGSRWFTRTWTLQEIVCSREAQVQMGRFTIPWDDLVSACETAKRCGLASGHGVHSHCEQVPLLEDFRQKYCLTKDHNAWSGISKTEESMRILTEAYALRSIPYVLPLALGRGVTKPQDKVFALFNVISERVVDYKNEEKYTSLIDYSLSLREVYVRAAQLWHSGNPTSRYNIARPGVSAEKLSFLDYVVSATENEKAGLPSWVPHWDARHFAVLMDNESMTGCQAAQGREAHVVFPAASHFEDGSAALTVRGVRLMTVHHSFAGLEGANAEFKRHAAMISEFQDPYPTTEMSYLQSYPKALYPEACDWACDTPRVSKVWDVLQNQCDRSRCWCN